MQSKIIVISGPQAIGKTTLANFISKGKNTITISIEERNKITELLKDKDIDIIKIEGNPYDLLIKQLSCLDNDKEITFIIESQELQHKRYRNINNVFYFNLV